MGVAIAVFLVVSQSVAVIIGWFVAAIQRDIVQSNIQLIKVRGFVHSRGVEIKSRAISRNACRVVKVGRELIEGAERPVRVGETGETERGRVRWTELGW